MDTKKPNIEQEVVDFCTLKAMMLEAIDGIDVSRNFSEATTALHKNLNHHKPLKVMVHGTGKLEQRFERRVYIMNRLGDSYALYDQMRCTSYYLSAIPSEIMVQFDSTITSTFALFFNKADLETFNRMKHKLALNTSVTSA